MRSKGRSPNALMECVAGDDEISVVAFCAPLELLYPEFVYGRASSKTGGISLSPNPESIYAYPLGGHPWRIVE